MGARSRGHPARPAGSACPLLRLDASYAKRPTCARAQHGCEGRRMGRNVAPCCVMRRTKGIAAQQGAWPVIAWWAALAQQHAIYNTQ